MYRLWKSPWGERCICGRLPAPPRHPISWWSVSRPLRLFLKGRHPRLASRAASSLAARCHLRWVLWKALLQPLESVVTFIIQWENKQRKKGIFVRNVFTPYIYYIEKPYLSTHRTAHTNLPVAAVFSAGKSARADRVCRSISRSASISRWTELFSGAWLGSSGQLFSAPWDGSA